jgi:SOS-response transcriptional repressor LexA
MSDAKYPNDLKAAMARSGVGPTKLADLIDTSKQNVTRWAAGHLKLTVHWPNKIAPHLSTTAAKLLQVDQQEAARQVKAKRAKAIEVPLVSWVAAGRLHRQDGVKPADIEKYILADLNPRGDWIALEVEGDSMDLVARDGAIIFVDRKDERLRNDDFYVFTLEDGSTTFKRYRTGKPPRLQPYSSNPDHETIYASEGLKIVGRVKRTLLDL